jgi:hypothetical protein
VVGGFEAWSATGLPVVNVSEPLSGELYARPAYKGGSAMGLVQIIGAEEIVRALMNVPDLNIVRSSVEPRGVGRWKVAAYASDEAIDAATALGAEVQVVLSTERDVQHRQQIASTIAQLRTERGEA